MSLRHTYPVHCMDTGTTCVTLSLAALCTSRHETCSGRAVCFAEQHQGKAAAQVSIAHRPLSGRRSVGCAALCLPPGSLQPASPTSYGYHSQSRIAPAHIPQYCTGMCSSDEAEGMEGTSAIPAKVPCTPPHAEGWPGPRALGHARMTGIHAPSGCGPHVTACPFYELVAEPGCAHTRLASRTQSAQVPYSRDGPCSSHLCSLSPPSCKSSTGDAEAAPDALDPGSAMTAAPSQRLANTAAGHGRSSCLIQRASAHGGTRNQAHVGPPTLWPADAGAHSVLQSGCGSPGRQNDSAWSDAQLGPSVSNKVNSRAQQHGGAHPEQPIDEVIWRPCGVERGVERRPVGQSLAQAHGRSRCGHGPEYQPRGRASGDSNVAGQRQGTGVRTRERLSGQQRQRADSGNIGGGRADGHGGVLSHAAKYADVLAYHSPVQAGAAHSGSHVCWLTPSVTRPRDVVPAPQSLGTLRARNLATRAFQEHVGANMLKHMHDNCKGRQDAPAAASLRLQRLGATVFPTCGPKIVTHQGAPNSFASGCAFQGTPGRS
jgi:hypothetical protein